MKKKITFSLAIALMVAVSSPTYAKEAEAVEVVTKNLENNTVENEIIPVDESTTEAEPYIPEECKGTMPYSIISSDERYRIPSSLMGIFPYSATVYIRSYYENGDVCRGTGWLFGPNDIATAGHVLCNEGELPTSVRCYFGANGSSLSGVTYYTATDISVPKGYINNETDSLDYGFISIGTNVGDFRGYYGWTTVCDINNSAMVLGYPGEHNCELWEGVKSIKKTDAKFIYYDTDTSEGQSGSAVYNTISQKVMGIHVQGGDTYNTGIKITRQISSIMENRKNN